MTEETLGETTLPVKSDADVVLARQRARTFANRLGFSESEPMFIATAVSEIARNLVVHGKGGDLTVRAVKNGTRYGIVIVATDSGPGIADIDMAMKDGFSTVNSLGLGLPGARRLMDEFHIDSRVGQGTTVTMKKWSRNKPAAPFAWP